MPPDADDSMLSWLLTDAERGNDATKLPAWTEGNLVTPLVHGGSYFPRLRAALQRCGEDDRVFVLDWRGDPDERLDGPGTAVAVELARAASAGASVRGLVWRSHLDRMRFSASENRTMSEVLHAVGGEVLLDMRVRRNGSHHQKLVVIRYPERPEDDVAFVGGIDLSRSRHDDERHEGDVQTQPMNPAYGPRPPWHDVQVEVRGPAVADLEQCFRERWTDPSSLNRLRPWDMALDRLRDLDDRPDRLPPALPAPPACGPHTVQVLRTYPKRRPAYPFAPLGERSVARAYEKALARAERLVYVEDQFLWSAQVARVFARALRRNPRLRLVAVVPRFTDTDSRMQRLGEHAGQRGALRLLYAAGGDRVDVYDVENPHGTPVYVHAKVCVIDDAWAAVGSANLNRRSWTHDSELAVAVVGDEGSFARSLRTTLWAEHVDGSAEDVGDPVAGADLLRRRAALLDRWYDDRCRGERPPGRLRRHATPTVSMPGWATGALTHLLMDPDARGLRDQFANRW